jgi:hypothetical protein
MPADVTAVTAEAAQPARRGPPPPSPRRRRPPRRLFRAAVVLLALVLLYFFYVFWLIGVPPPESPPLALVLIGAGYETNLALPHNADGLRALDDLQGWARDLNKGRPEGARLDVQRADLTEGDPVEEAVGKIKAVADPRKYDLSKLQTAVIFISAHGGADQHGAFLFFDKSSPASPAHVYRMDQALKVLKDKLPATTDKLFILDVTAVPDAWDMRMVHNDFVRALEAEPRLGQVKNLYVIVSSDKDQRAWRSDTFRRSVFAHYAVEGLKGAAARNDLVTAGGLYDHVKDKVSAWARLNRAALQEPKFIGDKDKADDVAVVHVSGGYKEGDPPGAPDRQEQITALWKMRDDLAKAEPYPWVYTPHLWRRYLDMTVRCEELLRMGDDEAAGRARDALNDLARRITEARAYRPRAVGNSLALGPALGLKLSDANAKKVNDRFAEYQSDPKLPSEKITELIRTDDLAQRPLIRARVTQRLLEEAVKSEADLTRACAVLEKLAAADGDPLPAEAGLLISRRRRAAEPPLDFELVKLALEVQALAERAAVGLAPAAGLTRALPSAPEEVLPWVRRDLEQADTLRRDGQDLLVQGPDRRDAARRLLTEAREKYKAVLDRAAVVRAAQALTARAALELPYLARWRSRLTLNEDDDRAAQALVAPKEKAWAELHALSALLAEPAGEKIDGLREPTAALKKTLDALRKDFEDACARDFPVTQRSWADLDDLLRCPLIETTRRVQLIRRQTDIAQALSDKRDPNAAAPTGEDQERRARAAATRQGRLALAALGEDAPEDARNAVERPQEGQWWLSFRRAGERVGDAFQAVGRRAENAAQAARRAPPDRAVAALRRSTAAARLLSGAAAEAVFGKSDPFDEMRRAALHELFLNQAERAFRDYWGGPDADRPHYKAAGRLYVRSAREQLGEGGDLKGEAKTARFKACDDLDAKLSAPER